MAKRVLSIDIGVTNTRVCEIDYGKKTPHVYKCISFSTPENVIEDGYIRNKQVLATVLRMKLDEADMKLTDVVFTISSSKIANREVTIPMVKDRLIQPVIDAGAQDYFPVDISEYIISYSILERIITKETRKLKLMLLAAPNNLIKNYYSFAEIMKFTIHAIDYIGNSSYQLLKRQANEGVRFIIQLNEQNTLIHVIDQEALILQRTIPYGVNPVMETESDNRPVIREKEEEFDNYSDAFEEEAAVALAAVEVDDLITDNSYGHMEELADSLKYLINNVIRVLDYYNSKFAEKKIDQIYITGPGGRGKGITELFQNEIDYDVKKLDRFSSVIFQKNINRDEIDETAYMSVIGAVLQPIGFVSKDIIEKEAKKSGRSVLMLTLAASLVISVALISVSVLSLQGAKAEQKKLQTQIADLSSVESVYNDYNSVLGDYQSITKLYSDTTSHNEKLNQLIAGLEERLPSTAVVSALTVNETGFSMNITTNSKLSAAKLYLQLGNLEGLSIVSIDSIAESEDENGIKMVTFAVNCQYSNEGKVAETTVENTENTK